MPRCEYRCLSTSLRRSVSRAGSPIGVELQAARQFAGLAADRGDKFVGVQEEATLATARAAASQVRPRQSKLNQRLIAAGNRFNAKLQEYAGT